MGALCLVSTAHHGAGKDQLSGFDEGFAGTWGRSQCQDQEEDLVPRPPRRQRLGRHGRGDSILARGAIGRSGCHEAVGGTRCESMEGDTPLMVATGLGWALNFSRNAPESWMAAAKYCLDLDADVNAVDEKGY